MMAMLQESECLPVCCGTCVCLHCQLPCQTVSHHCKSALCQSLIFLKQLYSLQASHYCKSAHCQSLISLKQLSTLCKLHTIVSLYTVNHWCPSNNSTLLQAPHYCKICIMAVHWCPSNNSLLSCKLHTIVSLYTALSNDCSLMTLRQLCSLASFTSLQVSTLSAHCCLSNNSAFLSSTSTSFSKFVLYLL